jgi:hypothetical protein
MQFENLVTQIFKVNWEIVASLLRNWLYNSDIAISLHWASLVPVRSKRGPDLSRTSKGTRRHRIQPTWPGVSKACTSYDRIMQSLILILTLILIKMRSHLFCMQLLKIVIYIIWIALSGSQPRIPHWKAYHYPYCLNTHVQGVPPDTGHGSVLTVWTPNMDVEKTC